jgi:hypothetical protein
MCIRKTKFGIVLLMLSGIMAFGMQPSLAQFVCPPGSAPAPIQGPPGAYMCRCPDGSGAGLSGCATQNQSRNTTYTNNATLGRQNLISSVNNWVTNWTDTNLAAVGQNYLGDLYSLLNSQQDQPTPPPNYTEPPTWQAAPVGTPIDTGHVVPLPEAIEHPLGPNYRSGWLPKPITPQTSPNIESSPTVPPFNQLPTGSSIPQSGSPPSTNPGVKLNPDTINNQGQLGPNNCSQLGVC